MMHVTPKKIVHLIVIYTTAVLVITGITQIQTISKWFIHANRIPANLSIDVNSKRVPLKHVWSNFAQGGEDPQYSLEPITNSVRQLQPEYIRIDHLFDFYVAVSRDQSGSLAYDFSKLDSIIHQIQAVGAKPFISLSYTPPILNPDITGIPTSFAEYVQILRATIQHISGKNGLNLANVYYEVWNEPDLFGQWKTYGEKNYLNLYQAADQAIKTAGQLQPLKLGGPATTKLYKNWILGLINAVNKNALRLDFISWHHYDSDPSVFKDDANQLREWLNPYPEIGRQLEIIVSEWGIDAANNPAYDSDVAAAYMVAAISYMVPTIDRAFIFEIQDGQGPRAYWGRWGLFTHQDFGSVPKPRARVIQLLNKLGDQQLAVNGQGDWVKAIASIKGDSLFIIVANYDYQSLHSEEVPLSITGLIPGEYRITQTYVNREPTFSTINLTSSVYQTTLHLAPNSVLLLTIER